MIRLLDTLNVLVLERNRTASPETTPDIPLVLSQQPKISLSLTRRQCPRLVFFIVTVASWLDSEGCKNECEEIISNFTPVLPLRRTERAEKRLSTWPSSSATARRWSCCSAGGPTWTPPCLTAARPCIWRWGGGTPPSLTSSASPAPTPCCEMWRMKPLWIWPTAMRM